MFVIKLEDNQMEFMDSDRFDIGKEVVISVGITGSGGGDENRATLITGEVTAVESLLSADEGYYYVIRGYDKSWRGYRGTNSKAYVDTRPDSTLFKALGENFGQSLKTESTKTQYEYIAHANQSSLGFMNDRIMRIGWKSVLEGGENLQVRKGDDSSSTINLKLGHDLMDFRPRATAAHQVDKVTVMGWNFREKEVFKYETKESDLADTTPKIKLAKSGVEVSSEAFKSAKTADYKIVDQPVSALAEAEDIAKGKLNRINSSFVQAEGLVHGNPEIMPGKTVNLEGIGTKFSGEYLVTSAEHVYHGAKVFETTFTVNGLNTNTFAELLNNQEPMRRWHGVYPGIVTDNIDEEDLYRAKVKFPWLDEDFVSDWARIVTPSAGNERGIYWLPEVNDEVLVAFEHGDINKPYILGGLWNGKDKAPKPNTEVISGGSVNQRIIKSRTGHTILLDDTDGAEVIKIFTMSEDKSEGAGHAITMDDANKKFTIQSASVVTITIDGDKGNMDIETEGDISITSKKSITIEAEGNIDIKSKTGNLNMEAKMNASLKGLQLALEAKTKAEVKGLNVSVNGSAMAEIKGGLVKIN
jgi:uncharacterized protein involved in type VI secretion and phage assembly